MPEESIAAYINNIIAFTLFIAVITFIFAILFLLSRTLIHKTGRRNNIELKKEIFPTSSSDIYSYKKEPYQLKNIFILGTVFIIIIIFTFLIFAVLNYGREPSPGLNLYLIIGIVFYLILMVIYLVKSKIIS
ncbi:unnamed protein product [marine sediment metagenome]|uniref:Uncharacterized protein n=1 Tax=marine sediment metagenome TaxID=412755 RepID=X1J874_9ZZZZ